MILPRRPSIQYAFALFASCSLWHVAAAEGEFEDGHECLHGKLERAAWAAHEAAAFDEASGRDLRNFPPDRLVDFQHMKLQLKFENLEQPRFDAIESISFTPLGGGTQGLSLDAVGLNIRSVKMDGKAVEFAHDGSRLSLRFEQPLSAGQKRELIIEYACEQPYDGMIFTPSATDAPDYTAEVHTQGQTNFNRHWFICHDSPNERMSTELIVDVPAGYSVSGNGKLVSNLSSGGRMVWHWLQEKPHCAYLVSLVIGKFDIVDLSHPRVPMKAWVPKGMGDRVSQTFGRTGEMIDLFERRFGVPYPWDRYDQLCVKNFGSGGMENTSATTLYPSAILDSTALLDSDLDGLIAHELAHQWTGDLLTCKGWEHIWLNEGWATYGSALWNEQRFGQDGYLDSMRGSFNVARRDRTTNELPMVSHIYEHPGENFSRQANPYPKGSSILHMLRMMLGEEVFWNGVHLYMNRHALGVVETNDFRYAMEEVSGRGLEWFFDQWCFRPGTPELNVKVRYDGQTRELMIDVEQAQKIDDRTPAFRFTLPVWVKTSGGEKTFQIEVINKTTAFRTVLDGPPTIVSVDPNLHVLKTMTVDKPLSMWIEQAKSGPTIAARHEAVEALGKNDSPEIIAMLVQMIEDQSLRHTLRNTAVDALGSLASQQAKDALFKLCEQGVAEARVRSTLVEKLRSLEKEKAVPVLAKYADTDASYGTRVAAIEGLARHQAADHAELIVKLVDFPSQHDQVRSAALRALADLDDKRGLDLAMKYAAFGHIDRSRPTAINCVGRLAKHDKERAVEFLVKLLEDPESRSMGAAGSALADLRETSAENKIRAMSETHRDPSVRERAAEWLKRLQSPPDAPGTAATQPSEGGRRRRSRD